MTESSRPPRPRRTGRSFFEVGLGLFGLTVIALIAVVAVYMRMIRYERVAALHLPPDTELAARLDVENVARFEPVRKNLFPLIDEVLPPAKPGLAPRRERLLREAKLNLSLDLREIVVGRGRSRGDVVVLLGGKFRDGLLGALERVLDEEGQSWQREPDGRVLSARSGVSLAQAEDGTLVIASSAERARAALPRGNTAERLGLSQSGPGALAGEGPSLAVWLARVAAIAPELENAGRVERVTGVLDMDAAPRVRLVVRFGPGTDAERATRELGKAVRKLAAPASPWQPVAGEKNALGRAEVQSQAAGIVEVVLPWRPEDLDLGAAGLARGLRRAFGVAATGP